MRSCTVEVAFVAALRPLCTALSTRAADEVEARGVLGERAHVLLDRAARVFFASRSIDFRAFEPRRSKRRSCVSVFLRVEYVERSLSTASPTRSRAISAAPTWHEHGLLGDLAGAHDGAS